MFIEFPQVDITCLREWSVISKWGEVFRLWSGWVNERATKSWEVFILYQSKKLFESLEFLESLLMWCQLEALSFWLFSWRNVKRERKLNRMVVVFCFQVSCFKAVFFCFVESVSTKSSWRCSWSDCCTVWAWFSRLYQSKWNKMR